MHVARVGKNLANIPIALLIAEGFMDRALQSLAPIAGEGPMLWVALFAVLAAAFTRVLARNALKRAQFPIKFARLDAEDKARNQGMFRRWDAQRRASWPAWLRFVDQWIESTGERIQQQAKALFQR